MSATDCPFCAIHRNADSQPLLHNDLAFVVRDRYPVSRGHLLIIPHRHALDWFDLSDPERSAINDLLLQARQWLEAEYQPAGYNIGMNCGAAAGQTVFHMHCHLIPRYRGDMQRPEGGVRGVIPGKQQYG